MAGGTEHRRKAGGQLQRIRIAEAPQLDGGKQVWHSAPGVEMITRVNARGQAFWQELTLEGRFVQWSQDKGLRTGREVSQGAGAREVRHDSSVVVYDPEPDRQMLADALEVADGAGPDDRYLAHLAGYLRTAMGAPQPRDTVTDVKPVRIAPPEPPKTGLLAKLKGLLGR